MYHKHICENENTTAPCQKLINAQMLKNYPSFYGTWRSIHYSVYHRFYLVPVLNWMNPAITLPSCWWSCLILVFHLCLCLQAGSLLSNFLPKFSTGISTVHVTFPVYFILFDLIILNNIGDYKWLASSLCNFLQPPVLLSSLIQMFSASWFQTSSSLCDLMLRKITVWHHALWVVIY
jgi:hypothetical protein